MRRYVSACLCGYEVKSSHFLSNVVVCSLQVKQNNQSHSNFKGSKFGNPAFSVGHYAGSVEYQCDGFLDKNNDAFHSDLAKCMQSSSIPFIVDLFRRALAPAEADGNVAAKGKKKIGGRGAKKSPFVSVGSQFKKQLQDLIDTLTTTSPYFVRCVKPNPEKVPGGFNRPSVASQLRCGGVVEAVRVCQAGYPTRYTYEELWNSMGFKILVPLSARVVGAKEGMQTVMKQAQFNTSSFQFGKSKLFFRVGVLAQLEDLRIAAIAGAIVRVQCAIRQRVAKTQMRKVRASIHLQRFARVVNARRLFVQVVSSMSLQARVRTQKLRQTYVVKLLSAAVLIKWSRCTPLQKKHVEIITHNLMARAIQSSCKQLLHRSAYVSAVSASVRLSRSVKACVWSRAHCINICRILSSTTLCMAYRRHRFRTRVFGRLVGKSVEIMQAASRRATAQKLMTARVASAALARFTSARVFRTRWGNTVPATLTCQRMIRCKAASIQHVSRLLRTWSIEMVQKVAKRCICRRAHVHTSVNGGLLAAQARVARARSLFFKVRSAGHLSVWMKMSLLNRRYCAVVGRRVSLCRKIQCSVRRRLGMNYFEDYVQRCVCVCVCVHEIFVFML